MDITFTDYVASFPKEALCPKDGKPEYAFIGRSNVGKSSLINMITDRRELARTSKKPGKTQMLNYYIVNKNWYIVDLPGYGYAKISKKKRDEWRKMIEGYMIFRDTLQCAFVLIDSRIPPQALDLEFIDWMGKMQIPFVLVFTKTDKPKAQELERNVQLFKDKMLETWDGLPQIFMTSADKKVGADEILDFIEDLNTQYFDTL